VQQQGLLKLIGNSPATFVMGDFNFRPNTEQYRLTRTRFEDAWLQRWPTGIDDAGLNPSDRIDHLFLSADLRVQEARYLTTRDSDHPALLVEIAR
jgi:endonuclease/exonuclease/phosphatase family metal-dependent hydrolase